MSTDMLDYYKRLEMFETLPVGGFCYSPTEDNYYIKPVQSVKHHLEGMLVELYTGYLVHYSILGEFTQVYSNEIRH